MLYETRFLISLLLTLIIEIPIVFILVRHVFKLKKIKLSKILIIAALASVLTIPYLWFVLPPYILANNYVLVGEAIVILAESLIYKYFLELDWGRAFLTSFVANLVSTLFGLLLYSF